MPRQLILAALALLILAVDSSRAAQVEADLTTHSVAIRADFAGAKVILFGSVVVDERDEDREQPDVVIVVRGPLGTRMVQRKQRIGGLWINTDPIAFDNVPGYYAVITSRPIEEIAPPATLRQLGIGLKNVAAGLVLSKLGSTNPDIEDYADAVIRIMNNGGLYTTHSQGLNFVGEHLFRAEFVLPSNVPIGDYTTVIYLIRDGHVVGRSETPLTIQKQGIERLIYAMAHQQPFLYGVVAVIAAVAAGLLAAAAFRGK